MSKDPEYEIVTSVAGKVIDLINRQRFHSSDSVTRRAAQNELEELNKEVKSAYGTSPPGWDQFLMRAGTFLDLSERHRGESQWVRQLDQLFEQIEARKDEIWTDELRRQHERVQLEEKARAQGLVFTSKLN